MDVSNGVTVPLYGTDISTSVRPCVYNELNSALCNTYEIGIFFSWIKSTYFANDCRHLVYYEFSCFFHRGHGSIMWMTYLFLKKKEDYNTNK